MNRNEVLAQIEKTLGVVPEMFKHLPERSLEAEWRLFSSLEIESGAIPAKYRELIGLAVAGVTKCPYCTFFHTEMAKVNGATAEEIEEAAHFAKHSVGWSSYVNGLQLDFEQFKKETLRACEHVRSQQRRNR